MNKTTEDAFLNGSDEASGTLHETQCMVQKALCMLNMETIAYEALGLPMSVLTVRFPVEMDDGTIRVFSGHRSQHSKAVGPVKGGIRFLPHATVAEVEAWSIWMSVKSGIANVPFGGSKGVVICDPGKLSFREVERVSRSYIRAIRQIVGPAKDIPAPDGLSNTQNVSWMVDEFSTLSEQGMPGFISGKPVVLGGTRGRNHVTTKGIYASISQAANIQGINLQNAKVMILGFGSVGSELAETLYRAGAVIVGISDVHGGIYNPEGLDILDLMERRDSFGTVSKLYQNQMRHDELLAFACDVLIFTSFPDPLTLSLFERLKARMVVEATKQCISNEAAEKLRERGILFVPEILANLGGTITSYLEWKQNRDGYYLQESQIETKVKDMIGFGFQSVCTTAKKYQVDLRLSSYIVGIGRLAAAAKLRAWI